MGLPHSETRAFRHRQEPAVLRLAVRPLDSVDLRAADSLGPAVRARAQGFHHEEDRRRFLAGRLAARSLVAAYLQAPEDAVSAVAHCPDCLHGNDGSHGEPRYFIAGEPTPLRVSFSRSGNWLAAALAQTRVGVDLEDSDARAFADTAVEDVMATDTEKAAIAAAAVSNRPRLRAQIWVRKEALLKASGQGLRVDPRNVETDFGERGRGNGAGFSGLRTYDVGPEQLGLPASFALSYAVDASIADGLA
ncbi:4'-phosphopantetheinyl transferase superfamily protein [Arthrobacter sp. zg-Y1110]|uniref:4'-phosphopantetheinyl transferase family protein n=1 Tax=Arthrobacter sp. zg-Y1110 TaxID=2886932 RepID=UPI001D140C9E|nr:4'-phosphopantetheinyl transferase superfamily protein [Arthrobacter sp. zg-Y1110]MCC3292196.1 4'-phosphopantetheinyl transferase superfamily protein [Arthrobacter sp. zg-Y1110]UWX85282.1 4'-phosphopantetheinyl transferase superfamily protein [Arthrobacter sp. zg-Y1110]